MHARFLKLGQDGLLGADARERDLPRPKAVIETQETTHVRAAPVVPRRSRQ